MVCLSSPYPFKFFKGCLPQILLGLFLNTLSHLKLMEMLFVSCTRHGVKVAPRPGTLYHRDPMNVETNRNQYFSTDFDRYCYCYCTMDVLEL